MPFYTFKCPKCKDVKEVLQSMNDSLPVCEECSTILPRKCVIMERVFGATGKPQFKGSGFYETDYKKKPG
jgi:putative FmdB family regulatory protein